MSLTRAGKTTGFTYLGMDRLVLREEIEDKDDKSYQYAPWNQKLTQITHKDGGAREVSQYTYRPRGDVEAITRENGNTRATYGYTAYGRDDISQFTGVDKADPANPDAEPYNALRFNASRWDVGSGTYDMGFRNYDPGLNRFLTRDLYAGALADMSLASDPFTGNRYAFAGGNPISFVELDGHVFGMSWSDLGHAALDVVGLVPVVGEVADVANGVWYAAEGNYVDAALSMSSAVPLFGYGVTAVKAVRWGDRILDAADTANDARRAANNLADAGRTADVPTPGRTVDGPPAPTRADTPTAPTRADTPTAPTRTAAPAAPPAPARATTPARSGGPDVLFGQRRISPGFDPGGTFAGRSIYDVAGDLRAGRLSPDDVRIDVFRYGGQLISRNNRSLAALSLAGLRPTNINIVPATRELRRRLSQTTPLGDALPSRRIAVTPSQTNLTILDVVHLPGI